jgi:hypothetical protein
MAELVAMLKRKRRRQRLTVFAIEYNVFQTASLRLGILCKFDFFGATHTGREQKAVFSRKIYILHFKFHIQFVLC